MSEKILPFNIDLLNLTDQLVEGITPVSVLDIFENNSKNFHPKGLFSTEIFGKVGSSERTRRFSYIQLNTNIIHPTIYKTIVDLKSFYEDIMSGKQYAIFDKRTKEFIKSDINEGDTGYSFFLRHLNELVFLRNKSNRRDLKIDLFEKFRHKCLTNRIVVIPAGYRDFEIDNTGKPTEDEINGIYRQFISKNSLLKKDIINVSEQSLDSIIFTLQSTFNELYNYIKVMLDGKNKVILFKWAARRIFNGTRNVASTPIMNMKDLDDPTNVKMNDTQVGLYQYVKATAPITTYHLRDKFIKHFLLGESYAVLTDPKTLKATQVQLNTKELNKWSTDDGIEKILTSISVREARNAHVIINDYYLAMVYDHKEFVIIYNDIDTITKNELFKNIDIKDIKEKSHPITYAEMLYISVCESYRKYHCIFTRYPITGYGSVYPSDIYLRTTLQDRNILVYNLLDSFNNEPIKAEHYPILDSSYFDTVAVSPIHMAKLGLDFDGDTVSFTVLYSEQANKEIENILNDPKYYLDFKGSIVFGSGYDTVEYIVSNFTA